MSVFSFRPTWWAALGLALLPAVSFAQSTPAPAPTTQQWSQLDPQTDHVMGLSTQRAYNELLKNRIPTPVIVAVIDAGVDTTHEDLRRVLWRNPGEIPGNGIDDDHNGYVDDVHGWNFLGGPDGRNVDLDTFEETRLVARLKPLYEGKTRTSVPKAKQAEFDLYQRVKKDYEGKVREEKQRYQEYSPYADRMETVNNQLKKILDVEALDTTTLRLAGKTNPQLRPMTNELYQYLRAAGLPDLDAAVQQVRDALEDSQNRLDFSLNLEFNPRLIVGDREDDPDQRGYGNADITGPDALHGTHVAGIIAADRTNGVGVEGIAGAPVMIMGVRAVPNGDEHDKDIANAIRYAVDNGAGVINMSFGKYYSPQRPAVDAAIRYAEAKGVLLVHAAGNEGKDIDQVTHYPDPVPAQGKPYTNYLTVGASSQTNNAALTAEFSNYGKRVVDVFAPGVAIYSTMPGNKYGMESGTSMAAPAVAGVAAVLKSYFPQLTAADLRRIIMQSAQPVHTTVLRPGGQKSVDFALLSSTGGVVNLYRAVELAIQQSGAKASASPADK